MTTTLQNEIGAGLADLLVPKRISVEPGHIANGKPGHCGERPVALAIGSQMGAASVEVGPYHIAVAWGTAANGDRVAVTFETPQCVTDFLGAFDAGEPVAPFTFELGEALPQEDG